ncbi:MAG: hypothetical protein IRY86_05695 [Thermorudis peleae]|nr:hypothetical protein [Thermorudis peleae]
MVVASGPIDTVWAGAGCAWLSDALLALFVAERCRPGTLPCSLTSVVGLQRIDWILLLIALAIMPLLVARSQRRVVWLVAGLAWGAFALAGTIIWGRTFLVFGLPAGLWLWAGITGERIGHAGGRSGSSRT